MSKSCSLSTAREMHGKKPVVQTVGIFRLDFPLTSETFIREQTTYLERYRPLFVVRSQQCQSELPMVALSDRDPWQIRQKLYTLTRSPSLLKQSLPPMALLHAHFGLDATYALPLARALAIPLLTTFHGYDITTADDVFARMGGWGQSHYPRWRQELCSGGTAFIAVSRFIKTRMVAKGFPSERIFVHYIGVDLEKFFPDRRAGRERYILNVGRHTPKKGIATLLSAFARIASAHPDVMLLQVGTGGQTAELTALADTLGIKERVRFLGALPHERVVPLMQGAELFALPSETAGDGDSEGLGIVFNEASACAVPIVATWHGGISEAVLDGETGLLAPERNPQILAEKIDLLLSNRDLAGRMGLRGRQYVVDYFDIRKQTAKLETIYHRVCAEE